MNLSLNVTTLFLVLRLSVSYNKQKKIFFFSSPLLEIEESFSNHPNAKIRKNPKAWKRIKLRDARQAGKAYTNRSKKPVPPKRGVPGETCTAKCPFACSTKVTPEVRLSFNNQFWALTDELKRSTYGIYVEKTLPKRRRVPEHDPNTTSDEDKQSEAAKPKKRFTFKYFIPALGNGLKIRVCRSFFCKTLNISYNRINYYFSQATGYEHGKHIKKQTDHDGIICAKKHILSFKTDESHYCRPSCSKVFLERGLNRQKMYRLFVEMHGPKVSSWKYVQLLSGLNIGFVGPKKDLCGTCFVPKNPATPESNLETAARIEHRRQLGLVRAEKKRDTEGITDNVILISYDLQQVLNLPKSNLSCSFYMSKLTTFNLTAKCANNNKTFCAMWNETLSGRTGNDIASALMVMLERIVNDLPKSTEMIVYSDNCIGQNKNSYLATAFLLFLRKHPQIVKITQKFGVAGHTIVNEVDASHSVMERIIRDSEIYSPPALRAAYVDGFSLNFKYELCDLESTDFFDFEKVAKMCRNMKDVPFMSICYMEYRLANFNVIYKTSYDGEQTSVNLRWRDGLHEADQLQTGHELSSSAVKNIKALFKVFSSEDQQFYRTLPGFAPDEEQGNSSLIPTAKPNGAKQVRKRKSVGKLTGNEHDKQKKAINEREVKRNRKKKAGEHFTDNGHGKLEEASNGRGKVNLKRKMVEKPGNDSEEKTRRREN